MINKPKVLISSPGAGVFIRQSALAYYEHNMLADFATTYVGNKPSILNSIIHKIPFIKSQLHLRNIDDIDLNIIHTFPYRELIRTFSSKMLNPKMTDKIWEWAEIAFDKWVANNFLNDVDIVHCYEHASLSTLQEANKKGVFSVYEQPSVHHTFFREQIVVPLLSKNPLFKKQYDDILNSELTTKRNKRKDVELASASLILCNSSYVKNSIVNLGIDPDKILNIPLGYPQINDVEIHTENTLTFVVAGNLSYLKGVHHILEVWKSNNEVFKNHKLVLVGSNFLSREEFMDLPSNVQIIDRLPRYDFHKLLREADILISNSYSDGFGMVITEGMANGLCVIATRNSVAPDIITHNLNGILIDAGDNSMLLQSMKWCTDNIESVQGIKHKAYELSKKYSWKDYRTRLVESVLLKYISEKNNISNK